MHRRWVIPDLHGCLKTLQGLVEEIIKPSRSDELYFLGDYIDRGPDSRGVLDYIRRLQADEYQVTALKGNHEDLAVELHDAELRSKNPWHFTFGNKKREAWFMMGGRETLKSFGVSHVREIPEDYIEWMRALPYFSLLDQFVLVHAGLNFSNEDPFEDKTSMLWLRDYEIIPSRIGNRRIIHGHMPASMELIQLSLNSKIYKFIDLDNGIYVQGREGYGNLVALELNSMELVIQDNRDL
jgi:serine/threonine protein phosphatase 1